MDLCSISVTGFRRFRGKATLKTNGKLVAIVGPNEAGKSSFLEAIRHLTHNEPPLEAHISRGLLNSDFEIVGRFFLSVEDLDAAKLSNPSWLIMTKRFDGKRLCSIEPERPKRDLELRGRLLSSIHAALEINHIRKSAEENNDDLEENWTEVRSVLQSSAENLESEHIEQALSFAMELAAFSRVRDPAAVKRRQLCT